MKISTNILVNSELFMSIFLFWWIIIKKDFNENGLNAKNVVNWYSKIFKYAMIQLVNKR